MRLWRAALWMACLGQAAALDVSHSDLRGNLSAPDYWKRFAPAVRPAARQELRAIASRSRIPRLRLRALAQECLLNGKVARAGGITDQVMRLTLDLAMKHLESHLDDPRVARFRPQDGFSHMAVGPGYVLIEQVGPPPAYNGGLNLRVDPGKGAVQVEHWGSVRP